MSKSRAFNTWTGLRNRCFNERDKSYPRYGGRGIGISLAWKMSFFNFYADMGDPAPGESLDRIDVNGDYCKENCRWATAIVQANNTSRNRLVTVNGRTQTVAQWSKESGLSHSMILSRINRGWNFDDILKRYPDGENRQSRMLEWNGKRQTVAQWARELGLNHETICGRLKRGLPPAQALKQIESPQLIEHAGHRMTVSQWAQETGLAIVTLRMRLRSGWTIERALTEPVKQ